MAFPLHFVGCTFLLRIISGYNLEASHPIIYEEPADTEESSYFGMSVAIRPKAASLINTWSIQIGAPRGTGPGQPGTVYRCHTFGPCRPFDLDKELKPFGGFGVYEFREKKDSAWVGVAMDVRSFGSQEKSVVCGHRWMNQNLKNPENIDVTYLMTGVCYLQDLLNDTKETPVQRLLPLVNKDKIYIPKPYVVQLSTYHWGLGQAGISVALTEQSSNLLIGAPGLTHWIGSVVRYEEDFHVDVGNFARAEVARKSRYTYLGYSLAFGRFYKDREIWFVAGAPRSANYRGQVFTFQFKKRFRIEKEKNSLVFYEQDPSDDVRIQSSLTGATFGEYFGSSLAAGDLNGDGYDDLIVGAPLFSRKDPDEGRIYVYLGTRRGNFLEPSQVINGRIGRGRFGSSIIAIKDLDQDGFGDVAVGAPYEDNKRGVVYIHRGFFQGLRTDYSQRIRAQDVHPHLRGFGISFSAPVDADGNKYLDVAVGAYLSGHVVLLRSRPVVTLHPNIKTENVTLIDRRESYFNVTVCSRYAGSNAPPYLDIVRIINIDPVYGRGTLESKTSSAQKLIRLKTNQIICEIHPIKLNLSKNFSPLQILLRNEIQPCETRKRSSLLIKGEKSKGTDSFSKMCPIGSKGETSKEIAFAGICGPDLLCRSDLEISCHAAAFRAGTYTLAAGELFVVSADVKNHGEPAYNSKIKIWSNLKLNHHEGSHEASSDPSRQTHWIDVEGLLAESYRTNFSFQIDLDALKEASGEIHLNLILEIFTSSLETNLNNNQCKFSVKLESDALVELHSSSSTASYYITKTTLQNPILKMTHYYEVLKTGITPVKDAELTIWIPLYFKVQLLTFEMETPEWMHLSDFYEQKARLEESESDDSAIESPAPNGPPTNRTLFLNCSTEESQCKILKVFFSKGIPEGFSSYVRILISLNITAIDWVKNQKDIVHMSTTGVLKYTKFFEKEPRELRRTASTNFYSEDREVHVDPYVIALSVLAGGFLFSLIVTGLAKSNFFKRSKKQELESLRDAEACFVYFANRPNLEENR